MTTALSQKGARSREKILNSALEIIGRDGLSSLSMRSVATEASVPLGAVTYYFESKQQLIGEAFLVHSQRELRRVISTVSSIGGADSPADLARVIADFLIDGLQNSGNALVAEYEFLLGASRRADLARASSAWLQSLQAQLTNVLQRLGSHDAVTDARLVMAVMAGLEVDNLTREPLAPAQLTSIRLSVTRLFAALTIAWNDAATQRGSGSAQTSDRGELS